jgi:hypothetical protein
MLGHKATDKITGLKGVITAYAEFLHAPKRIELSPVKLEKGEPAKPVWLDEPRLKVSSVQIKVPDFDATVELGKEVTDSLTGFKGIATGRFVFMNGCIRIEVTPTTLKDGVPLEAQSFDEQRLTPKSKAPAGGPRSGPTPYSRP